jgi:hypothetical protein
MLRRCHIGEELLAFPFAQQHARQLLETCRGEMAVDEDGRVVGVVVGSDDDQPGARGEGDDPHAAPPRGLGGYAPLGTISANRIPVASGRTIRQAA